MSVGAIVLTQGRRPAELAAAVASLLAQRGVELDVVVVGNGWVPEGLPDGVKAVHLPVDAGIPGGRNAGVPAVSGNLLFFLDDDARLPAADALARVEARFDAEPDVGLLQLRVAPSTPGVPPRDWVPRLRVGDPSRPSDVTAVWEGAVAMPRAVFERVGGWPAEFRFAHEGIDLAWRVLDTGKPTCRSRSPSSTCSRSPSGRCRCCGARARSCARRRAVTAPDCASRAARAVRCV
jgi:GT2 family glycosyltransferase